MHAQFLIFGSHGCRPARAVHGGCDSEIVVLNEPVVGVLRIAPVVIEKLPHAPDAENWRGG